MTSGQRMVWANAYALARFDAYDPTRAARTAGALVRELADIDRSKLDEEALAMLDDVLGDGADRKPVRIADLVTVEIDATPTGREGG